MTRIKFPDIPYDDEKLNQVWAIIQDILDEKGGFHVYDIRKDERLKKMPYPESTVTKDLLPKMRERLLELDLIEVSYEDGDTSGPSRKVWRIT